MNQSITGRAIINALATAGYVALVGSLLAFGPQIFGLSEGFLVPVAILLLLVISAAITGSLVFGLPILWYLDGKKSEAVSLLINTLAALFVITLLVFIVLFTRR